MASRQAEILELERRGTAAASADFSEAVELGTSAGRRRPTSSGASATSAGALGGLAGVGMGAVFGGPVGLALGGLTGIVNYMQQKGAAAKMAEWENSLAEIDERTSASLARALEGATTQEDRDQIAARELNWQNTMAGLRMVGPERGGQIIGTMASQGRLDAGLRDELEDMESRQEKLSDDTLAVNRGVVTKHGEFMRGEVERIFAGHQELQAQMGKAHALLADPKTNIDHPIVQAELGKLLEQTKGNLLTNAEDMTDALRSAGGAGFFGTIAQVLAGTMKAEEMKFSRDEWRQLLAINERVTLENQAADRERIYGEAAEHVGNAGKYGIEADPTLALLSKLQGAEAPEPRLRGPGGYPVGVEGAGEPAGGYNFPGAGGAPRAPGAPRPTNGGPEPASAYAPETGPEWFRRLRERAQATSSAADDRRAQEAARRAQEAATAAEWEAFERRRAELNAAGAGGGLVEGR